MPHVLPGTIEVELRYEILSRRIRRAADLAACLDADLEFHIHSVFKALAIHAVVAGEIGGIKINAHPIGAVARDHPIAAVMVNPGML